MQKRLEGEKLLGKLEFPGGKIEVGETPQLAASRELFEECGIKIDLNLLKLFKVYTKMGEKSPVQLFVHLFLYEKEEEISCGNWYELDTKNPLQGIEEKIMPANSEIIKDVVGFLTSGFQDEDELHRNLSRGYDQALKGEGISGQELKNKLREK